MGKVQITRGRDFSYTLFLQDKDKKPFDITGFNRARLQKKKGDGTLMTFDAPLTPGINEIQTITFPTTPTSGSYKLDYGNGNITVAIPFSSSATVIQNTINDLQIFSQVLVTGVQDQATGLTLTYPGTDGGRDQNSPTIIENSLSDGSPVIPVVSEITKGVPEHGLTVISAERGELLVTGNENDSNALAIGTNQPGVLDIRVGTQDLNIPSLLSLYDVEGSPLV